MVVEGHMLKVVISSPSSLDCFFWIPLLFSRNTMHNH